MTIKISNMAIERAKMDADSAVAPYAYPVCKPRLPVSNGVAMDSCGADVPDYMMSFVGGELAGFAGYPKLAHLSTRAEYRQMASSVAVELTRKWVEITSSGGDDSKADKIQAIMSEFDRFDLKGVFQRAAEHDCYFGRGQIYLSFKGHDSAAPLVLSNKTIKLGSLDNIQTVEAMWTTPDQYNSNNPLLPNFYKPTRWIVFGEEVHASRLLTVVTRPLPDILKPAFNFSGMSLSQLAEPYVDNWLRTRQSVSDLINNFSTTALKTDMVGVLTDGESGSEVIKRAELFTATRSNKGMMLLDNEREDLVQINTPLSGLHELQAQAQEHLCSVSRIPAMILTGISPSGLNASSEGEIRAWYDWLAAQQSAFWYHPLETIFRVVQLSLFGEIDSDLKIGFVPLYQMTEKELAEIKQINANVAATYIDRGVIDGQEERERLSKNPTSGYDDIDPNKEIEQPMPQVSPGQEGDVNAAMDALLSLDENDWDESKHPRAENGQFGSGGASGGGGVSPDKKKQLDEKFGPQSVTNHPLYSKKLGNIESGRIDGTKEMHKSAIKKMQEQGQLTEAEAEYAKEAAAKARALIREHNKKYDEWASTPEQVEKKRAEGEKNKEFWERYAKEKKEQEQKKLSEFLPKISGFESSYSPQEASDINFYAQSGDVSGALAEARKHAVSVLARKLTDIGADIEKLSESNNGNSLSAYVRLNDGTLVRISDHELPMTEQRKNDRERGLTGIWDKEFVIDDLQEPIESYLNRILGKEE